MLVKKYPLLDKKNRIVGIISYLMDVTKWNLKEILATLQSMGVKLTSFNILEIKKYKIDKCISELSLSRREEECLYYLLQNKTAKEMAKILFISHRTVESYLNNLKDKFKCQNKTTLIIKAMELGCAQLIPENVLLECYIVNNN